MTLSSSCAFESEFWCLPHSHLPMLQDRSINSPLLSTFTAGSACSSDTSCEAKKQCPSLTSMTKQIQKHTEVPILMALQTRPRMWVTPAQHTIVGWTLLPRITWAKRTHSPTLMLVSLVVLILRYVTCILLSLNIQISIKNISAAADC